MSNQYDRSQDLVIFILAMFVLAGAAVIFSILEWN